MEIDLYCKTCRNAKDHKQQDNEICWSCVAMGGALNYKESITNYNLLIRKTPEELAAFQKDRGGCPPNNRATNITRCRVWTTPDDFDETCRACWLDWLKLEAETDG